MYHRKNGNQRSVENFFLPFGGKLSGENRWVKLAELIPWDQLEHHYASKFSKGFGAPSKSFRMALGALIIKEKLQVTDEELVEQIKENPYLQFFLGLEGFQFHAPFDPSMMVYFRRRLPADVINDCNERIVHFEKKQIKKEGHDHNDNTEDREGSTPSTNSAITGPETKEIKSNQGILLIDATCISSDSRYSTDLSTQQGKRNDLKNDQQETSPSA